MWFVLSLTAVLFWGGSDLFSKLGSPPDDLYSHWKITAAVGLTMGLHATVELISGAKLDILDFVKYSPAIVCYISSMVLGYIGLRYLMLSVLSPVCNSSGAVACILCLIFLRQIPDLITGVGIVLICLGVTGLALVENESTDNIDKGDLKNKKYFIGFGAIIFPILYCILDGLGTFADAVILDRNIVNESSANIAYEYTFFAAGVVAFIYVYIIRREKLSFHFDAPKAAVGICETAGQLAYIYAIGSNPTVVAPMVSSYCVVSVALSRIFLKEKLSLKHYLIIFTVLAGIVLMGISEGIG